LCKSYGFSTVTRIRRRACSFTLYTQNTYARARARAPYDFSKKNYIAQKCRGRTTQCSNGEKLRRDLSKRTHYNAYIVIIIIIIIYRRTTGPVSLLLRRTEIPLLAGNGTRRITTLWTVKARRRQMRARYSARRCFSLSNTHIYIYIYTCILQV